MPIAKARNGLGPLPSPGTGAIRSRGQAIMLRAGNRAVHHASTYLYISPGHRMHPPNSERQPCSDQDALRAHHPAVVCPYVRHRPGRLRRASGVAVHLGPEVQLQALSPCVAHAHGGLVAHRQAQPLVCSSRGQREVNMKRGEGSERAREGSRGTEAVGHALFGIWLRAVCMSTHVNIPTVVPVPAFPPSSQHHANTCRDMRHPPATYV